MTGIEILASQEVATAFTFNWLAFWIAAAICMGVCMAIGAVAAVADADITAFVVFVIIGAIAVLIFGPIAGYAEHIPTEYETQYKVTISDEVQMNDFLERYEIIDQEGKIYTVRERNER